MPKTMLHPRRHLRCQKPCCIPAQAPEVPKTIPLNRLTRRSGNLLLGMSAILIRSAIFRG
ncbi:hypothetical protein C7M52_02116 [Mixta theicola]|nr:hypothetical protein C7M52_02116 [Mixta theicola]